jgi:hypothetical protein
MFYPAYIHADAGSASGFSRMFPGAILQVTR